MATEKALKGRKGGSSSSRTPTEQPDDLQSVAKAKILVSLGEGEFAGQLNGRLSRLIVILLPLPEAA